MVAATGTSATIDWRSALAAFTIGRYDPTARVGERAAVFAMNAPSGPVTLAFSWSGATLDADAWGPGRDWALAQADAMAGRLDDPGAFDPPAGKVAEWHRRSPGLRIGRSSRVFEALVPTVIAQRVTSGEAVRSWHGIVRAFGAPAPRSPFEIELRCPPTPAQLAAVPYFRFHRFGIDRGRADTIRFAARRAERLEQAVTMTVRDAYERLLAFPGVGQWTAATVLAMAIGDPDAVPVGDYHLPNIVAWNLAGEARADDARMLELLEPYRGQRARCLALVLRHGAAPPRFGPRQKVLPLSQM